MAVTTYAAIDIGSYDLTLEIFEISAKNGIHCINKLRHRLELGRGTFSVGRIAPEMVDELCNVLRDFRSVMKEYKVDSYDAIATSAIREAQNDLFVLGRIRQLTGLEVRILSNSEQRFLSYKAIASIEGRFKEMIQKGTVVIDLDGGSIQISIFDNSELIQTANMRMGSMRIRERLQAATAGNNDYDELVRELIHEDLDSFSKMYLKNRKIENIILNGDFITEMIFRDPKHRDRSTRMLTRDSFEKWYRKIAKKSVADLAINNNIAMEYASLLRPSAILYHLFVELMDPVSIWAPGTHLSRGLAYEYAENKKLLPETHDFENDIISCARHLAKRYGVTRPHIDNMDMTAKAIFDATKEFHGIDGRGRLLLGITTMLHDVGKYISYTYRAENTYNIIMTNEIIGISHAEREIVALAAKYIVLPFPPFEDLVIESGINRETYLEVASLTAIIRLANALDRSHMQKIRAIDASVKKKELVLKLSVSQDYSLESGLIREEADFFTEVFGIRPVLKIKRTIL